MDNTNAHSIKWLIMNYYEKCDARDTSDICTKENKYVKSVVRFFFFWPRYTRSLLRPGRCQGGVRRGTKATRSRSARWPLERPPYGVRLVEAFRAVLMGVVGSAARGAFLPTSAGVDGPWLLHQVPAQGREE